MEGPSLHLAAQQLKPFKGKRILAVSGNAQIDKGRLKGQLVSDLFAWGKHLVLQCDGFALRVHFLMFGTYEAEVEGLSVTGDYKRSSIPRLALSFPNGELRLYTCSVVFMEGVRVRRNYDFSIDVLSKAWRPEQALMQLKNNEDEEIADVLLDQTVFAGVGNIIKNEVLSLQRINPMTHVSALSTRQRKALITEAVAFSKQFLAWRKKSVLTKNLRIHRKANCPYCNGSVTHVITGTRKRRSHFCNVCQPIAH